MRNITVVGLVFAVLVSFTACDDGGTTPTLGNTPAQALEELERAFNDLDAELLERLLDTDFTFHFDEDDVGDGPGDYIIPESWGKEEFLEAVGNLFLEAYSIDMEIDTSKVGTPDEGDTTYLAQNVEVKLLVMVDSINGYLAHGFCNFGFAKDTSGGYDNWRIKDWWDFTYVYSESTNRASIGWILAYFYAG